MFRSLDGLSAEVLKSLLVSSDNEFMAYEIVSEFNNHFSDGKQFTSIC